MTAGRLPHGAETPEVPRQYEAATGDRYRLFLDPLTGSLFFWWVTNVRTGVGHSVLVRVRSDALDVVPLPRRVGRALATQGRSLVEARLDRGDDRTAIVEVTAESFTEREVGPKREQAGAPTSRDGKRSRSVPRRRVGAPRSRRVLRPG